MRSLVSTCSGVIFLALAVLAAGCGNDTVGSPDGGGGTGGSGTGGGGSGGGQPTDGAMIDTGSLACPTAPVPCPTPAVTFADVEPIFKARCSSVCHNDKTIDPNTGIPIWGLTDYDHIVAWQDTLRPAMINCTMPPVDAGVPVTLEERTAILAWIRCGLLK